MDDYYAASVPCEQAARRWGSSLNIYGRAREERLWTVVEQVAQAIRVISVSRPEGAITVDDTKALISQKIQNTGGSGGGGNRTAALTHFKSDTSETKAAQVSTNSSHINTL